MKVLLTGANGQLGRCVQDVFARTDYELVALDRAALDISDAEAVSSAVAKHKPQAIINAAAYTAVDKAEAEPELAAQINTVGPGNLARAAEEIGAVLIHISTDYVFDGRKTSPYVETDATNPQGVYGRTKLAGEQEVQRTCSKHIIIRTAWVFSEYSNNFVKTMLRLGKQRKELNVVSDQVGCPTYAGGIASACMGVLTSYQNSAVDFGIYHYCGGESMPWFDFSKIIFEVAVNEGALEKAPAVNKITTIEYPTPAERPMYSVMDSSRFAENFSVYEAPLGANLKTVINKIS